MTTGTVAFNQLTAMAGLLIIEMFASLVLA